MLSNKKSKGVKRVKNKTIPFNEGSGEQFVLLPYRRKEAEPYRFLQSMSAKPGRFAWEYYKRKNGAQFIRCWFEHGLDEVVSPLLTSFQEAQISPSDGTFFQLEGGLIGGAWELRKSDYYPLRIRENISGEDGRRDRLAEMFLSVLRDAHGEFMVQILFEKANYGWNDYVWKEALLGMGPRKTVHKLRETENSHTGLEIATDIEEKMSSPSCFKVQVRVVGSGGTDEELRRGFQGVSDALRHFDHRTQRGNSATLRMLDPGDLDEFFRCVRDRTFYSDVKAHQKAIPFIKKGVHPRYLCARELRWFFEIPIDHLDKYQMHTANMASHLRPAGQIEMLRTGDVPDDISVIGRDQRGDEVYITEYARHVYVSGKTGVGKSTVLQHMVLDKVKQGKNVVVLDPHGDLVHDILSRLDTDRLDDVIYISPLSPIGFNALSVPEFPRGDYEKLSKMGRRRLKQAHLGADEKQSRALANMIKDHFGKEFWGPRLDSIFSWFSKGLLQEKGANFVDFYHILNDKETARKFARDTDIPELEHYVNTFFEQLDDRDKHSTLNKIGKIRRSRVLRQMLCVREPDLNISDLIEPGKIVLINLSKGLHDKDIAHFIGSALSNLIWSCIGQRELLEPGDRGETYLFADEFHCFASDVFTEMLSEGRKFGLRLVLANQYTHQLNSDVWSAIVGNVGSFVSFAGPNEDAEILVDNFGDTVDQHEFVKLEKFHALVRLPEGDVVRIGTYPPRQVVSDDSLEYVLKRMERLSPNVDMKMQRANTPRWESDDADRWDILMGVYRKQIEAGGPPFVSEVKKEEPRNNLEYRLEQLNADNILDYRPVPGGDKVVALNHRSKEEIMRLIGTSNRAGGDEHKETILHLWEFLESVGCRTHIVRQNQSGVMTDLTIEFCGVPFLDWNGVDIEVEHSTPTKPARILRNLAKGENKDRLVLFFVEDERDAEKVYNIIRMPLASGGKYYKSDDGREFKPELEFSTGYWKPSGCGWEEICGIFVFSDGRIREYSPTEGCRTVLSYDRVVDGRGYLIDGPTVQSRLPEVVEEPVEYGKIPPVLLEADGEVVLSNRLKAYFMHRDNDDVEMLDLLALDDPEVSRRWEQEYECSKLSKAREQPASMPLELRDMPSGPRALTLVVESMFAYSMYPEHGYHVPQKPVTTRVLRKCLREQTGAVLPDNFGNQLSDLFKSMGVESTFDGSQKQNLHDISPFTTLLTDLYRYILVQRMGEGTYTYPGIYNENHRSVGRYTVHRLFEHGSVKFEGYRVEFFRVVHDDSTRLVGRLLQDDEVSIDDTVLEVLGRWGMDAAQLPSLQKTISHIYTGP